MDRETYLTIAAAFLETREKCADCQDINKILFTLACEIALCDMMPANPPTKKPLTAEELYKQITGQ